jgi:hypothetical protein
MAEPKTFEEWINLREDDLRAMSPRARAFTESSMRAYFDAPKEAHKLPREL